MEIKYCPTEMMLADYFTKPLQGRLFHSLRDIIMGKTSIFEMLDQYFPIKERVGNNEKCEEETKGKNSGTRSEVQTLNSDTEIRNILGTDSCDSENTDLLNSKRVAQTWADVVRNTQKKNQNTAK